LSRDLQSNAVSMLVGIDTTTDEIVFQLELDGLENCGTPKLGPDARTLAIACTGPITSDGESRDLEASGVLLLDATERPPRVTSHWSARAIAGEALQSELEFVTSELLLVKTQTALGAVAKNRLLAVSPTDRHAETVFTSSDGGIGRGLVLGSILCAPGCSDTCLVTDSGASVLRRFGATTDGGLDYTDAVPVEGRVGLPPIELTYR
jgi:hypothetical protein